MQEEVTVGLPWPIMYIVTALYLLVSDGGAEFEQHITIGVPSDVYLPESEVLARAYDDNYESLQFSENEGSRGVILKVVSQEITRILVAG